MKINFPKSAHLIINGSNQSAAGGSPEKGEKQKQDYQLPKKVPTYGFLIMDSRGNWVANMDDINEMKKIMQTKLEKAKSIFEWVRIYNKQMKFMAQLLGDPSHGFFLFYFPF